MAMVNGAGEVGSGLAGKAQKWDPMESLYP